MILKALLLLASTFALFWTFKTKKIFPSVITLGMIVGVILTLFLSRTFDAIAMIIEHFLKEN